MTEKRGLLGALFGQKTLPSERQASSAPQIEKQTPSQIIEIRVGAGVIEAREVVPQADKLAAQQERAMLEVIAELEKARETLGNFCVTIGEGEDRVVMLNAVRKEKVEDSLKRQGEEYSKEWRVLFTRYGIREIGLVSEMGPKGFDQMARQGYERLLRNFKEVSKLAAKANQIGNSPAYVESETEKDGRKETTATLTISSNFKYTAEVSPWGSFREVTDENLVLKALKDSIEGAQRPIESQIKSSQATLKIVDSVGSTLKI